MSFKHISFYLYLVAGAVTAFHVYTLLSIAVYGAPYNPLELVALLGSLGLLIAAYISLFRPLAAAKVALLASLLLWSFYAPAIAKSVRARFDKHTSAAQAPVALLSPR